ncbi:hypothetical protein CVT24_012441 [Panaeolus cyanescens]|uniref:Uncharacterized protein n=1 Tax=Panaeolus cyanescens TaxID=181874 RepID=A0A409YJ57_9AGAR|nr:hypothetical protein CVT24_012441 [Panaeolus cyanescens]
MSTLSSIMSSEPASGFSSPTPGPFSSSTRRSTSSPRPGPPTPTASPSSSDMSTINSFSFVATDTVANGPTTFSPSITSDRDVTSTPTLLPVPFSSVDQLGTGAPAPSTTDLLATFPEKNKPLGAIVGGVIGGVVFLVLLLIIIILWRKLQKRSRGDSEAAGASRKNTGMWLQLVAAMKRFACSALTTEYVLTRLTFLTDATPYEYNQPLPPISSPSDSSADIKGDLSRNSMFSTSSPVPRYTSGSEVNVEASSSEKGGVDTDNVHGVVPGADYLGGQPKGQSHLQVNQTTLNRRLTTQTVASQQSGQSEALPPYRQFSVVP